MTNLLMLAYDYLDEIKANQDYQRLVALNQEIDNQYAVEIKEFKAVENQFNEVMEFGKYHPDFKDVAVLFSKVKKDLYEKPLVKEYLELDLKVERMINSLLSEIAEAISPNIPVKNAFGFIKGGGNYEGC